MHGAFRFVPAIKTPRINSLCVYASGVTLPEVVHLLYRGRRMVYGGSGHCSRIHSDRQCVPVPDASSRRATQMDLGGTVPMETRHPAIVTPVWDTIRLHHGNTFQEAKFIPAPMMFRVSASVGPS